MKWTIFNDDNGLGYDYNDITSIAIISENDVWFGTVFGDVSRYKPEQQTFEETPDSLLSENTVHGNYPNPFNPITTLYYEMTRPGKVTISIYNAVGQQIKKYDIGNRDQGIHETILDASSLTSGIYFYHIDTGYTSVTGKMLYMK